MTEVSIIIFARHFFRIFIICTVFECLECVVKYTKIIIIKYLLKFPGIYSYA